MFFANRDTVISETINEAYMEMNTLELVFPKSDARQYKADDKIRIWKFVEILNNVRMVRVHSFSTPKNLFRLIITSNYFTNVIL